MSLPKHFKRALVKIATDNAEPNQIVLVGLSPVRHITGWAAVSAHLALVVRVSGDLDVWAAVPAEKFRRRFLLSELTHEETEAHGRLRKVFEAVANGEALTGPMPGMTRRFYGMAEDLAGEDAFRLSAVAATETMPAIGLCRVRSGLYVATLVGEAWQDQWAQPFLGWAP